ncbi:MAG: nuclear transport factor 2 family protein [Pyrinomonadaceae bacterium]
MKLFILLALALLFASAPLVVGQKKPLPPTSEAPPSKKIEREILKMESQLKQALEKCNTASLNRILADYYADSEEGSERAVGKKWTIDHCRDGEVRYYSIDEDRELSVRVDIVFIEGVSKVRPNPGASAGRDEKEREKEVRVKRLWTKKGGRWLLIAQTLGPMDEETEK